MALAGAVLFLLALAIGGGIHHLTAGIGDNSEQIAALQTKIAELETQLATRATLTLSPDAAAKAAEQERLEGKFLVGIYDEETVAYAFVRSQDLVKGIEVFGGGNPRSRIDEGIVLGQYFNYLATGIENGAVSKSAVLSLVARYEEVMNDPYRPPTEEAGSSLREAVGRIKFAEPPASP